MEKAIVRGMRAMPGEVLYRIVDPSVLWVEASVYAPDLAPSRRPARGDCIEGAPGRPFDGPSAMSRRVSTTQSRTALVRFELPNRERRLKAGMFASVDFSVPLGRGSSCPPMPCSTRAARQLVFVSERDGYFEPRESSSDTVDGRAQS